LTSLLVGLDALELGLDICHVCRPSGFGYDSGCGCRRDRLDYQRLTEGTNSFETEAFGRGWNDGVPNPSTYLRKLS
jgi:hypothetical protein